MVAFDVPGEASLAGWASSGLMSLTGARDGPPVAGPGDPAGLVDRAMRAIEKSAEYRTGRLPALPDSLVLGERAAMMGLNRAAPGSCGGAFGFLRTLDHYVGISLARPDDLALVPALVQRELDKGDEWAAVRSWASRECAAEVVDRIRLLGLPGGEVPMPVDQRQAAWELDEFQAMMTSVVPVVVRGGRRSSVREPFILDFTSLWAGPLCAHLLGLSGARVLKVEAETRLDGARRGARRFYDLLHAGHESITVDLESDPELRRLRELVADADLVLESSRSRALREWGLVAEDVVASGTSWVSITARGRASNSVGFGDDVAAEAGLVVWRDGQPWPCGDALADPLTGVVAALAASHALQASEATLTDVSMLAVARAAASLCAPVDHEVVPDGGGWFVRAAGVEGPRWRMQVTTPGARRPMAPAALPGEHNRKYRM